MDRSAFETAYSVKFASFKGSPRRYTVIQLHAPPCHGCLERVAMNLESVSATARMSPIVCLSKQDRTATYLSRILCAKDSERLQLRNSGESFISAPRRSTAGAVRTWLVAPGLQNTAAWLELSATYWKSCATSRLLLTNTAVSKQCSPWGIISCGSCCGHLACALRHAAIRKVWLLLSWLVLTLGSQTFLWPTITWWLEAAPPVWWSLID